MSKKYVSIRCSFDPEDPEFDSPEESAEGWLRQMEESFKSAHVDYDFPKISICLANLKRSPNFLSPKHGQFNSFAEFKTWFLDGVRLENRRIQFDERLSATVQTGAFRDYYLDFKMLREENQRLNFFYSEPQLNAIFIQNLRNVTLRRMLKEHESKPFSNIVRLAEQLFSRGLVKDRESSVEPEDNGAVPGKAKAQKFIENGVQKSTENSAEYSAAKAPGNSSPQQPKSSDLPGPQITRVQSKSPEQSQVGEAPQSLPQAQESPTESAESSAFEERASNSSIESHADSFIPPPPSYSPGIKAPTVVCSVRLQEETPAAEEPEEQVNVTGFNPQRISAVQEPGTIQARSYESCYQTPYEQAPEEPHIITHEKQFERPYERPYQRPYERPTESLYSNGRPFVNTYENVTVEPVIEAPENRIMLRSMRFSVPEASNAPGTGEDGWKYRFTLGDTECSLDTSSKEKSSLEDAAKAWLDQIEHKLNTLDFRSQEEHVSFCLHNLTGFARKAANLQPPFRSYPRFKNWFCKLFDLSCEKRDVVMDLLETTQNDTIEKYKLRFQNIHDENEFCKYPVSPQLVKEFFIRNLAEGPLKDRVKEGRFYGLVEVFSQIDFMLSSGEFSQRELLNPSTHANSASAKRAIAAERTASPSIPQEASASAPNTLREIRPKPIRPFESQAAPDVPPLPESPIPPPPLSERPVRLREERSKRPLEERISSVKTSSKSLHRSRDGESEELFPKRVRFSHIRESHYTH